MSNLRELPPPKDRDESVAKVLEHLIEQADHIDALVVLTISKHGGAAGLRGSRMSGMEYSYLLTFFQAFMNSWHEMENE